MSSKNNIVIHMEYVFNSVSNDHKKKQVQVLTQPSFVTF